MRLIIWIILWSKCVIVDFMTYVFDYMTDVCDFDYIIHMFDNMTHEFKNMTHVFDFCMLTLKACLLGWHQAHQVPVAGLLKYLKGSCLFNFTWSNVGTEIDKDNRILWHTTEEHYIIHHILNYGWWNKNP